MNESKFLTPLDWRHIDAKTNIVLKPLIFFDEIFGEIQVPMLSGQKKIYCSNSTNYMTCTFPMGFVTDGLSVPRIFWTFVTDPTEFAPAGVLHDLLWRLRKLPQNLAWNLTAKECNEIFYRALISLNCPKIKADLMFQGLQLISPYKYGVDAPLDLNNPETDYEFIDFNNESWRCPKLKNKVNYYKDLC